MEIGARTPTPVLPTQSETSRSPTPPPAGAVATELPPAASVQPISPTASSSVDAGSWRPLVPSDVIERRLTIDPTTHAIVAQAIDRATGDVVSQVPDQGLLCVRAYLHDVVAASDAKAARSRHQTLA